MNHSKAHISVVIADDELFKVIQAQVKNLMRKPEVKELIEETMTSEIKRLVQAAFFNLTAKDVRSITEEKIDERLAQIVKRQDVLDYTTAEVRRRLDTLLGINTLDIQNKRAIAELLGPEYLQAVNEAYEQSTTHPTT